MEAKGFMLTCAPPLPPVPPTFTRRGIHLHHRHLASNLTLITPKLSCRTVLRKSKTKEEEELHYLEGLPEKFHDDEWQAAQREKTKELQRLREEEDEEENKKIEEYREIGMRLKDYPDEEVREARKLVSSFIRAGEEVEEKIEEAAERGELTELVLMVVWNRLDLARRDDEKDAIRSLDLLYRRIETEILKREATGAMRLLNDLLNLHDGFDDEGWLKQCRKQMVDTFPREDPFSLLVPSGFDINTHQGPFRPPPEDSDDLLLRIDFVREVDALLQEVRAEQEEAETAEGFDAESIASRLKQHEKQRTINQIEALLNLAASLKW
ncbi:hypothetical protein MKW92_024271 [Papaver armeniacum]|nr:hypothetical protein MKW92_024271 [Papaver armeniacum]